MTQIEYFTLKDLVHTVIAKLIVWQSLVGKICCKTFSLRFFLEGQIGLEGTIRDRWKRWYVVPLLLSLKSRFYSFGVLIILQTRLLHSLQISYLFLIFPGFSRSYFLQFPSPQVIHLLKLPRNSAVG